MSENDYFEVRRLLSERKIEEAEEFLVKQVKKNEESITKEYWLLLISSEVERHKKEYAKAENLLEKAIELSKRIELSSIQRGRAYGKLGTIFYFKKKYSEAFPLFHKALEFTTDDLIRRNYFYSRILFCFYYLQQREDFQKVLKHGVTENFQKLTQNNWNTVIDFIWTITHLAKKSPWEEIVIQALLSIKSEISKNLHLILYEFAWARIARNQNNHSQFINHMKKSINLCEPSNEKILYSLKFNLATMLVTPFGDYTRAKDLLLDCLKLVPDLPKARIFILNRLGSTLRFIGEYNDAIRYLNEAIMINKTVVNDVWQEAYTHNTLGMIYTLIGDNIKAMEHYEYSKDLNQKENDDNGLGYTYGAMAWLESNQGNLDKAKNWYQKSIATFENITQPPAIVLLAYAELLSRLEKDYFDEINKLIIRAKEQIWRNQKRLDMGRYYNTLGKIAMNQKRLDDAQNDFSQALEYSESFEVEAQTLLGMTKVNLEFFLNTDNSEFLDKAELFLTDLRLAAKSSVLILCEVDLILGIIEMYKNKYGRAAERFKYVIKHAKEHNYSTLENRAQKQLEILQVMQSHKELQNVIISSGNGEIPHPRPIKEVIDYLNDLLKLMSSHPANKRSKNERL
ncbi:MAG: tetratricopeptide repeat protein [Candidatus Hermodarchaeota archaeon]